MAKLNQQKYTRMYHSAVDPSDKTKRIQTTYTSANPRDLNGPPYSVAEGVFDEYDMEACTLVQKTEIA
jgi:hypothetical protein